MDLSPLYAPQPDIATSTFSYDGGNRLTEIAYTYDGGTAIDAYSWTYDAANRVASMTTTTDGTAEYSYDDTNQVAGASYTGTGQPANESYSYDSNGNRTNTGYSTGTNNQVSSDGTFNYTYDDEGNRITRTRISSASADDYLTTYAWDYRDRLTDVEFYDNSSVLTSHVHYTYDVFDHRISKSLDSTGSASYDRIEDYVYDGDHIVLDFVDPDGAGSSTLALATRYLNGPGNTGATDQVFAQEDASTGDVLWLLSDNLGSTRDIVDDTSAVLDHFVYNSFGQLASGPTNVTRFLYTGQEWDADAGLQYNWHRWYDPEVGRWISHDPIGFDARDANVSRYVGNLPTAAVDPTGLIPDDSPSYGGPPSAAWYPPVTTPNAEWPLSIFADLANLTPSQENYVSETGCFGLAQVNLNMYAPNGNCGTPAFPYTAPGTVLFDSQQAAMQYLAQQQAAGVNAQMMAFQFNEDLLPASGPLQYEGQVFPSQVAPTGAGNTAVYFPGGQGQTPYWQYMNEANPGAIVYNSTTLPTGWQTTVYGIVPPQTPPPPPPPQSPWWQTYAQDYSAFLGSQFWGAMETLNNYIPPEAGVPVGSQAPPYYPQP